MIHFLALKTIYMLTKKFPFPYNKISLNLIRKYHLNIPSTRVQKICHSSYHAWTKETMQAPIQTNEQIIKITISQ